jgi:putative hydrolase of the HAD superfamily
MTPGGLILDLDDTLYQRRQFMRSGFRTVAQHVAVRHGLGVDTACATLDACLASGDSRRAFQTLCASHALPETDIPLWLQVFREHQPALTLDDPVRTTLRRLRLAGWRIAVLTNGLPSVQERKVAALGLPKLVDHVVFAEQHSAQGKPAAEPFRHALARLGMRAARCVCVGDDPATDIAGARALGIRTIRVTQYSTIAPARAEADAVAPTFSEVPSLAAALLERVAFHAA